MSLKLAERGLKGLKLGRYRSSNLTMADGGLKGLKLGRGYRSSDLTMAEGGLKGLKLGIVTVRGYTLRAYFIFSQNPVFLK